MDSSVISAGSDPDVFTTTTILIAEAFTKTTTITAPATTRTAYFDSGTTMSTGDRFVEVTIGMPLTCESVYKDWDPGLLPSITYGDLKPNPDIAGKGILIAYLITTISVFLIALISYATGLLPSHSLRRVDRAVFFANSRNEESRWCEIADSTMMCLSDQQLVTGLAILIAGYVEMMNDHLDLYHWTIVVYLGWLSSSVHIASLTLLREKFKNNPRLRDFRVAGMTALLALLVTAMVPLRRSVDLNDYPTGIPARCLWKGKWSNWKQRYRGGSIDPEWILSLIMLFFAYAWKLSQLFDLSRRRVRKWMVAKPEAALERSMRRSIPSDRSSWLQWLAHKALTVCYLTFLAYAEAAESFIAAIVYLFLVLAYGITIIFHNRAQVPDAVHANERQMTFGQTVPLLFLILPMFSALELIFAPDRSKKLSSPHSKPTTGHRSPPKPQFPDLSSALNANEASQFQDKMQNDKAGSYDPIIDHTMSSKAFKSVVCSFFVVILIIGVSVVTLIALENPEARLDAYRIMSNPSTLNLEYSWPNGHPVSSTDVDSWELNASRRALRNLKTLLAGQSMLDLLNPQIEEADAYYKGIIEKSEGQYKESRIDLKANGITVASFLDWWKEWMGELQDTEIKQQTFLDTMVPAHPEHYALPPYPSGIIETIGEHIARVQIKPVFDLPDSIRAYGDASYKPLSAIGTLDDGSILFYILQELRDCEGGCEFRLRLLFPAAAPEVFFEEHAEHLAVEFRSFITSAFERQQRIASS
ncbi:hypothetical protein Q7P37_011052 [Cladosporium fusiforme]